MAVDEKGQYDEVVDYRFTSSEGRDLIRGPARELGWTEVRGGAERSGLYGRTDPRVAWPAGDLSSDGGVRTAEPRRVWPAIAWAPSEA